MLTVAGKTLLQVRPPDVTESGSDDDDDDHLYEKVPEEMLSELRLNSILHNLPEGVSVY